MTILPALPRVELARTPTPIDYLEGLSDELGVGLYVKRDDLTGAALSGNKVRKLEFVLPQAMEEGAEVVITCGGAFSNHCRATAIAARRFGLEVELFLRGLGQSPVEGNLLMDLLMGAALHHLSDEEYAAREEIMDRRARELGAEGLKAVVIPEGASSALGSLGYLRCMEEILDAQEEGHLSFDTIVVAVGSGGTLAGLLAGADLLGFPGEVIGVPVCHDAAYFRRRLRIILEEMKSRWFPKLNPEPKDSCLLEGFVGEGYGKASAEDLARIRDVAVLTGLILDPVYTSKAFSGLLSLIRSGRIPGGSNALFVHTGGLLGLFNAQERHADAWSAQPL